MLEGILDGKQWISILESNKNKLRHHCAVTCYGYTKLSIKENHRQNVLAAVAFVSDMT